MDTEPRPDPALGPALLSLAREALARGPGGALPEPPTGDLPGRLREPGASFVTLTAGGVLRGCCGHLEATGPLAIDVWRSAHASAYRDPRFPGVRPEELAGLEVEVAVLGAPEAIDATSEAGLLSMLEPGRDGLILTWGAQRATFLPKVWLSVPDPSSFLRELRRKAGLPGDFWSENLRWARYRVESYRDVA